jgi:hypothetical protein
MVLISDSSAVIAPPGDSGTTVDLSRPFLFMVPFWGERYRRYFVERLLPSLLAPNNLPLLRADEGHRFLIATTPEDWAAIVDLPIIRRLRQHATPTLIEIPKPTGETAPGSTSAILHQDVALKLLAKAAFQGKGYGSLMWPDCIISDGMVASLIKHARAGRHLVLCPALRQAEESAISELKNRGLVWCAIFIRRWQSSRKGLRTSRFWRHFAIGDCRMTSGSFFTRFIAVQCCWITGPSWTMI